MTIVNTATIAVETAMRLMRKALLFFSIFNPLFQQYEQDDRNNSTKRHLYVIRFRLREWLFCMLSSESSFLKHRGAFGNHPDSSDSQCRH